jgi:hypothetical protein
MVNVRLLAAAFVSFIIGALIGATLLSSTTMPTMVPIFVGPVTAVLITLWWQQRKEKQDAKMRLFITLMSHRGAMPLTSEWVKALNLIDITFAPHARVVELWHQLYELLHHTPIQRQMVNHKNLEMLSEIAAVLGFRQLQQIDIDKYYYPQTLVESQAAQTEAQAQWLRVLKNTEHFLALQKKEQ